MDDEVLYNISCLHSEEKNNSFLSQKICVHFRSIVELNSSISPCEFFSHNNLLLIFNYFWSTDSETVRLPYEVNEFYSFWWFCKLIGWDHCSYCVTYIGHIHVHSLLALYMYHQMYTCGISGVKKAYILSFLKKKMNVVLSQKTHTCKLYRYRSQSSLEPHH